MRVAHVLPTMGIGGVEVAIERSYQALNDVIDYRVFTVRGRGPIESGQRSVASLLVGALTGNWRPDVVVTSLWWAHPFGAVLRMFGVRWLAFFHNTEFSGSIQKAIHSFAWKRADGRLVDSAATHQVMASIESRDSRVIPYIFPESAPAKDWQSRTYDLIWVGRDAPQKRTDLVAAFLEQIAAHQPEGRACLLTGGGTPELFRNIDPGVGWQVDCFESLPGEQVRALLEDARFFLLTSDHEGMSMATVEAVFAGCVPVVRLVGELRHYIGEAYELTIDGGSASDLDDALARLAERWTDAEFAAAAQTAIRERLAGYSSYTQEFLAAVKADGTA